MQSVSLIRTILLKKIRDGYAFSVSKRYEAVAADDSVYMYFKNPSTNTRTIYMVAVECSSNAQGWVDVYRNVSVTTPGTAITPINLNLGSSITSSVEVRYGGVYDTTGATKVHETVAPGGTGVHATGWVAEVGEAVLIPPDDYDLLFVYTNKSGAAEDMSIRMIWWEEEGVIVK
jgi:hypothetical protein